MVFNEIMYHPATNETNLEFVELYNMFSYDTDVSRWAIKGGVDFDFPDGTVIAATSCLVVAVNPSALQAESGYPDALGPFGGRLANNGETLRLENNMGRLMDEVSYDVEDDWPVAPDGSGVSLVKIDPDTASPPAENWGWSDVVGGSPGTRGGVFVSTGRVINEIASAADTNFFVELHHHGVDVPAVNHVLVSSGTVTGEHVFSSALLSPGSHLVRNETTLGFHPLDEDKLFLYLSQNKNVVLDAAVVKISHRGRFPEGTGRWLYPDVETPGSGNSFSFHDEIVINEVMYHKSPLFEPYTEVGEEWIELYNRGASTVDLTGWSLDDGVEFDFPAGTMLNAGSYLVIAKDAATMSSNYPTITVLGDFNRRLSDGGERIRLIDANRNPADEIYYHDGKPWPDFADGGGSSMELRDPDADNAIPEAWAASDETGQSTWRSYSYTNTASATPVGPDGVYHEFVMGLLGPGVVLLDDLSVVEDPSGAATEFLQNGSFQSDGIGSIPAAWRIIGTHRHSEVVVDPDDPANKVLRLVATGTTGHMHNHAETTFASGEQVNNGTSYAISFKAKWLNGTPQLHTRLFFSRNPKVNHIDMPTLNGTPGEQNSTFATNIGPTYVNFGHSPTVPGAGAPVTVSVKAADPAGIASMTTWYSIDGGSWSSVTMAHQGAGVYTASIPGQTAGQRIQFYVEGQDSLGALSTYPAGGTESRAMYRVNNGEAVNNGMHNFRIVTKTADATWLHTTINAMSNDRLGATVIYNESKTFYDVGLRLKGWTAGRFSDNRVGFNVRFNADQLFRGVHETVSIDRSEDGHRGQREMMDHLARNRGGTVVTKYNDLVHAVTPKDVHIYAAELQLARFTDVYLGAQYENGGDGMLFEYELISVATSTDTGTPEGNKLQPNSWSLVDVGDHGVTKEDHRWALLIKNNRKRDDYSRFIQFTTTTALPNPTFNQQIDAYADRDQIVRNFAAGAMTGAGDTIVSGTEHNAFFYVRPSDQKVLFFPHDLDGGWFPSRPFIGTDIISDLVAYPGSERLYYAYMRHVILTAYNSTYLTRWANQFGNLLPAQPWSTHLTYVTTRGDLMLSEINSRVAPQYAFQVTTPGGTVGSDTVTVDGDGWLDLDTIKLEGMDDPLQLTWTKTGSGTSTRFYWQAMVPLDPGSNTLIFVAHDFQGDPLASNTVTFVSTATERPLRDNLRVTELMYHPAFDGDDEFIELSNIGTSALDLTYVVFDNGVNFAFAGSSVSNLAPGEYVVVARDLAAFETRYGTSGINLAGEYSGTLANGGETFDILGQWNSEILSVTYDDARGWPLSPDGAGHSLVPLSLADQSLGALEYGGNWRASTYIHGSPGTADPTPINTVMLNELKAHTDTGQPPPFDSDDWIELYSAGPSAVTLTNWYLSDDADDLKKFEIWGTDVISPGGWQAYTEDNDFHTNRVDGFGLDKAQEQVFLSYLPGNTNDRVADAVSFKGQEIDDSLGRYPDGDSYWYALSPTFDTANTAPSSRVVINEIMYQPAPTNAGDNSLEEFLEICNATAQPVTMANATGSWRLDGVDYTFPPNTQLSPSECLLVVSFDPTNTASLNTFTTVYGLDTNDITILGPYAGKLSNRGERVALERPQAPDPPSGDTSWVIVDEVIYFHRDPWTDTAAGSGLSLHRVSRDVSGNDPNNWQADDPSPESSQTKIAIISPLHNADIPTPFSFPVEIEVDATQVTGAVQQVELFDGMNSIGVDMSAPYVITWSEPRTNREAFLRAELTDGSGITTSAIVRVTTWILDHQPQVSMLTDHSVQMDGALTGEGSALASFFYGLSDGGTDQGAWDSRVDAGQIGQGTFSATATDLDNGRSYYFRAYATNNLGDAWSGPASMFSTPSFALWEKSMKIRFDGYCDTETLTNFPALVTLSTNISGFDYGQFGSPNGADLRFTDAGGTNALNYEVENWNTSGESPVWVQVPEISGPTDFITAYWGQTNTTSPQYSQDGSTWSEGYELVLHLNGDVNDSVSSPVTVIDQNSMPTSGIAGGARDFESTNNSYLEPLIDPSWYGDHITNLTISVWGRPDSTAPQSPFGVLGGVFDSLYVKPSLSSWSYRVSDQEKTGSPVQATQWQMLGIVLDDNTASGYHNDIQHNIGVYGDFVPADRIRFGDTKGDSQYFDGRLDEARISRMARSPAWMRASYKTMAQNDAFTRYLVDGISSTTSSTTSTTSTTLTSSTSTSTTSSTSTATSSTTTSTTTTSTLTTSSTTIVITYGDACVFYPVESYGGTNPDTVQDASGNGQDGIADGGLTGAGQPVPGRNGNSARFPGGNDIYVAGESPPSGTRFQNQTLALGTNDFTVMMWVRATGTYNAGGGSDGRVWLATSGLFEMFLSKSGTIEFTAPEDNAIMASTVSSAIPVDSQWYHVAVVVNRDNLGGNPSAIYVNAVDVTSNAMEATPTAMDPAGSDFWEWGRTLNGQGDDFAIFKKSLSQFEIASLTGLTTTSTSTLSTSTSSTTSSTSTTSTSTTTSTTSIFTTSTSSTTSPITGSHDVSFTYTGGYFSFEIGDIDPGLAFGHGFLTPGSGDGARFDFWFAPDGVVDGSGVDGGGGATPGGNYAAGGDDVFMGSRAVNEDGIDQYMGGAGLDVDSFAGLPGSLTNYMGPGFADGTVAAYGRVFENDNPQEGDWYYVSASEVIRNQDVMANPPNTISFGRGLGLAGLDPIDGTQWSFVLSASVPPPMIVDVNTDVTLWAVYTPTGTITPMYSTNLGTVPIEWIPISVFSNSLISGTNVFEFDPPDTNASAVKFQLWQTGL